jgi:DNA-binding transcriptional regulator YiaG
VARLSARKSKPKKGYSATTKDSELVRTTRTARGLTQTQFGELLGVVKLTVLRWEAGVVPLKQRDRLAIKLLVHRF